MSGDDFDLPIPKSWEKFESIMLDLFTKEWNAPDAQKNGRKGQVQHGVDIWGHPNGGDFLYGAQCKKKDQNLDKQATIDELRTEVEKAKSFEPPISRFYFATTGPSDQELDMEARKITDAHKKKGLFSVVFWGWDEIVRKLWKNREVLQNHYSDVYPSLNPENQSRLLYAKELIDQKRPKTAIEYLIHLKEHVWDDISDSGLKYVILKYLGVAYYHLGDNTNAAKNLIEALQYNKNDEKALCNAALGHFLFEDKAKCKELILKVQEKNPTNSQAYILQIQCCEDQESLESIIDNVPKPLRKTTNVAYAIGNLANSRQQPEKAIEWLSISIENSEDNWPEPYGLMGIVKFNTFLKSKDYMVLPEALKSHEIQELNEIHDLFTKAWNEVKNTEIKHTKLDWLANRSEVRRLLGDFDDAVKDIEEALKYDPENLKLLRIRGQLAAIESDYERAIKIYTKLCEKNDSLEDVFSLAMTYFNTGQMDKVKITLSEIDLYYPDIINLNLWRLMIDTHLKLKEFNLAIELVEYKYSKDPENPFVLATFALLSYELGKYHEANTLIERAVEALNDKSPIHHLQVVVDELYKLKKWGKAAVILERYVSPERDSQLLRLYIQCLYSAGREKEVIRICQTIRKLDGPIYFYSEIESYIYEGIGDLKSAKMICEEYLQFIPNDIHMKIRLALVLFRMEDYIYVDSFLKETINFDDLSLTTLRNIANLHLLRGNEKTAVEISYFIRERFFDDSEAHLFYVQTFLQLENNKDEYIKTNTVELDTSVQIEDVTGKTRWLTIEDRGNSDLRMDLYAPNHEMAKNLLGKKVGDTVVLSKVPVDDRITVKEIKSKYLHALHISYEKYQQWFPESGSLAAIPLKNISEEGNLRTDFQPFFDILDRRQKHASQIDNEYREGKLTIGAYASIVKKTDVEIWQSFSAIPNMGIRCAKNTHQEQKQASNFLGSKPKLILDITSVLTIYNLEVGDVIMQKYGKFGISQSSVDQIRYLIEERGVYAKGHMIVKKINDQYVKYEITDEDMQEYKTYLKQLYSWISEYCEIHPSQKSLDIDRDERERYIKAIGQSSFDSIMLAQEDERLLISDDELLRALAQIHHNVNGVWTQAVLFQCLIDKDLTESRYLESIISLINLNYRHIGVNPAILLKGAEKSNWSGGEPFEKICSTLNGEYSELNSTANVVSNFILLLWNQKDLLPINRELILYKVLDGFLFQRNKHEVISYLRFLLKLKFKNNLAHYNEILNKINIWHIMNREGS